MSLGRVGGGGTGATDQLGASNGPGCLLGDKERILLPGTEVKLQVSRGGQGEFMK